MGKPSPPPPPDYTPFAQGAQATAASDVQAAQIQADVAREQLAQQGIYAGKSADIAQQYADMAQQQTQAEIQYAQQSAAQGATQGQLEQQQLALAQGQYADIKPYLQTYMQQQLDAGTTAQANLQLAQGYAKQQAQQATDTYNRYATTFAPKEAQFANEAFNWASPTRIAQAQAAAQGDVSTAFQAQRDQAQRQLMSYGIDPSQARYAGTTQAMNIGGAAAQAAAGTQAGLQAQLQGNQYELAALQLGRGLPGQAIGEAATGGQLSTGALQQAAVGGAGIGAGYQGMQTYAGAAGSPTQYANLANPFTQLAGTSGSLASNFGNMSNPYTSLSGAYGSTGANIFSSSNQALANATGAYTAGADMLSSGFNNQMSIYKQQSSNQASLFGGLGALAGAAITKI
jgi:hypothetical protein